LSVLFVMGFMGCQPQATPEAPSDTTPAGAALSPEADAAAQVAVAALAALSDADEAALRELMHPAATLTSLSDDPDVDPRTTDLEQFIGGVTNSETDLLERMWDPTVLVDGRLATVWTPYDFYRDGEFSHCGTDVFHMIHDGARWRVLSIAYTVHREGCAESPLGPPA